MKKTMYLVIVTGLILRSDMVTFAQMHSMMGGDGNGMMMGKHPNRYWNPSYSKKGIFAYIRKGFHLLPDF